MNEDFLNQIIKTRNLTEGQPRHIVPTKQGVLFLRSNSNSLLDIWMLDELGREKVLVEVEKINRNNSLTNAEKIRRERLRLVGNGITSFDVDKFGKNLVFSLAGRIFIYNFNKQSIFYFKKIDGAFDPRLSPNGNKIAYVKEGSLYTIDALSEEASPKLVAKSENDALWGMADFIAAEEMDRYRGFWWSPDSTQLLATRVDQQDVNTWQICDPTNPENEPNKIKYPKAGSNNAKTDIFIFDLKNNSKHHVKYNFDEYEYAARISWNDTRPVVALQDRSQKVFDTFKINKDYQLELLDSLKSDSWIELTPGLPVLIDGQFINAKENKKRNLTLNGKAILSNLHLRAIHATIKEEVIFSAWEESDAKSWQIYSVDYSGEVKQITKGAGVRNAFASDDYLIVSEQNLYENTKFRVFKKIDSCWQNFAEIRNLSKEPIVSPDAKFIKSQNQNLEVAVILPKNATMSQKLPILMMPYGGPHAQMVVEARDAYLIEQWWANQGFAVVIADGRGSPGRNIKWEKSIKNQLLNTPIEDQIEALDAACLKFKQLDRKRVGIVGWSFGGFLAGAALLKNPEIFKAAISGAPVTNWQLYDTHYTERYLGDPKKEDNRYGQNSLIRIAKQLKRSLMLIHGMADDNVVVAHSLKLSEELFKHGKMHQFLPLANVTHMAAGTKTAKSLLEIQLKFFKDNL